MVNAPTNNESPPSKPFPLTFVLVFIAAFIYFAYSFLTPFYNLAKSVDQWNELKTKSDAHAVMVKSYRDCRNKFISGTISECQVLALNYGRELGFINANQVFDDIVDLSNTISKDQDSL